MSLLSLKNTLDGQTRTSEVQWYEHVIRRDNGGVLRRVLDSKVVGKRWHG